MTGSSRSFAFLTRPKWIAGHVLALVAIVAFVNLGLWQLRRLDERKQLNRLLEARLTAAPVPWDDLVAQYGDDPDALEYRMVLLDGSYVLDEEVILRSRSYEGMSGHHVLTPLLLDDGTAVVVDRGWVPIDATDPPVAGAEPPTGRVEVIGIIRTTQVRGSFGPVDPPDGVLTRIARVDLARLQQQSSLDLAPVYAELQSQEPPQATDSPIPVPPPEQTERNHLSYAIQWFLFAVVVAIGYPILIFRTSLSGSEPAPGPDPEETPASPV
jgi:surfeit locus 1 family protein